jgi:hypothetical protein
MTTQQWQDHEDHMMEHISWPASKKQIVDACKGEDVEPDVLKEIKAIPDREYESAADLKGILIDKEEN